MATVRNKKGKFSKTGVVLRAKKIGELKTSVVKDKTTSFLLRLILDDAKV